MQAPQDKKIADESPGQVIRTVQFWLPWFIVGAAMILRLWNLGRESLWFDEIYTADLAQNSVPRLTQMLLHWGNDPPLHYYAVWASLRTLSGLGVEIAVRLPSVVAGTLSGLALYLAARHLWNRSVGTVIGLIAAGAFALAPFQVEYAQEAHPYALMVLWTSVAAWGLVWATDDPGPGIESRRWWHPGWAIWFLGATLALYTHYVATLTIVGLALFGVLATFRLQRQGAARPFFGSLIWLVSPFLLFLPWPVQATRFSQMFHIAFGGADRLGPRMLSVGLVKHLAYVLGAGEYSPWRKVIPPLALLGIAAMVVRREWRGLWFVALWFLPSIAFLWVMPSSAMADRYLILWAPTFFLLVARGVYALAELAATLIGRPAYRPHIALLLGVLCCLALWPGLQHYYTIHKQDWRGVARLVDNSPPMPLYAPFELSIARFYAHDDSAHPTLDSRDPDELQARLLAEPRAWLIVNQIQRAFDPEDRMAGAWRPLNHVDLAFWGDLHLIYVGGQAKPSDLIAEVSQMELPAVAPVWLSLAEAQRKIGDVEAARRTLRRAVELARTDPSPDYVRDAADEARLLGDLAAARALYGELLVRERAPAERFTTLMAWAIMERFQPNPPAALDLLEQALRLQPDDVEAHANYGAVLLDANRPADAAREFEFVVSRNPQHFWGYWLGGLAYQRMGQLDRALTPLQSAIDLAPDEATRADVIVKIIEVAVQAQNCTVARDFAQRFPSVADRLGEPQRAFLAACP